MEADKGSNQTMAPSIPVDVEPPKEDPETKTNNIVDKGIVIVPGCDNTRFASAVDPIYVPPENVVTKKDFPPWSFNSVERPFVQRWERDHSLATGGMSKAVTEDKETKVPVEKMGYDKFMTIVYEVIHTKPVEKEKAEDTDSSNKNESAGELPKAKHDSVMGRILTEFAKEGLDVGV